jgi:hypothetical protein
MVPETSASAAREGEMKAIVFGLILTIGLVLNGTPREAQCAYCTTDWCMSKVHCSKGCVCLKKGMDREGECVSLERAEELRPFGWTLLE